MVAVPAWINKFSTEKLNLFQRLWPGAQITTGEQAIVALLEMLLTGQGGGAGIALPQPGTPAVPADETEDLVIMDAFEVTAGQNFTHFTPDFSGTAIMLIAVSVDSVISMKASVGNKPINTTNEQLDGQTVNVGQWRTILIPISKNVTYSFQSDQDGIVYVQITGTRRLLTIQNPTMNIASNQSVNVNSGNITATISGPVTIQTSSGTPIDATITGTVNISADQVIQVQNTSGGSLTIAGTVDISAPVTVQTASGTPIQATISGPVTIQTAGGTPITATITGTVNIAADQVIQVQNTSGGSLTIAGTVDIGNSPSVTITSGNVSISSGTVNATIENAQIDSNVINDIINTTNTYSLANLATFSVSNLTGGTKYVLTTINLPIPVITNGMSLIAYSENGNSYTVEAKLLFATSSTSDTLQDITETAGSNVQDIGRLFNPGMVNQAVLYITPGANVSSDTIQVSWALSTYSASTYNFFNQAFQVTGSGTNASGTVVVLPSSLITIPANYPLIFSVLFTSFSFTGDTDNGTVIGTLVDLDNGNSIIASLGTAVGAAGGVYKPLPLYSIAGTPGHRVGVQAALDYSGSAEWTITAAGQITMAAA